MAEVSLDVEQVHPGTVCVTPRGELDTTSAYDFDEEVRRLQDDRPRTLVVDLRHVTFLDSAGLGRLIAVAQRGRQLGERVCFVRGPRSVTRLFALTAAGTLVQWVRTPEEAWAATAGMSVA